MSLIEVLSYPFMVRALIVGCLVSLCAAVLGVILVLKRYSLIGHGLADVGFAALSLAMALNLPPLYVSMPIVIIASVFIMIIAQRTGVHGDIAIGMVATTSLSIGVIITAMTRGFNIDVYNYMFGSILAMTDADVALSAALSILVLLLFVLFYNRLFLITYDESYAKASGINVTLYQFMISFLTSLTVVLGMRMMGTLLISSLIIFPVMIARKLVNNFKLLVIVSAIISVVCFLLGIVLSFFVGLPTGASVVVVNTSALVIASVYNKLARR